MKVKQQEKFRMEFKSIVYQKGLLTVQVNKVKRLHAWDKDGSHKNAILSALDTRTELHIKLIEMLNDKKYEEWKSFSSRLSRLNLSLKIACLKKEKIEREIEELVF